VTIPVPQAFKGMHKVEAVGGAGNTVFMNYTVQPSVALSPTMGMVGSSVTVTLRGYDPNETIAVKWYALVSGVSTPTTLGTATADAKGSATFTFTVPAAYNNSHLVEGYGNISTAKSSANYNVKPKMTLSRSARP
jgi:hypothetical protein